MICKELNIEFKDKREMFAALKASKELLIKEKKSQVFKSCEKGLGVNLKTLKLDTLKTFGLDDKYYYIAVNTTNILDSHNDLHVKGIWNRTVKDQQGKNYLLTDHEMKMGNVVAKKEKVEMFVEEINYSSLGKSYSGTTQALIYKVHKDDVINPIAKDWLESKSDIEASVRMQYVNVELALNSNSRSDKEEKAVYDQYINEIANKEDFESIEYFWVVKEAKNIGESSLVLEGSNGATGVISEAAHSTSYNKNPNDPSKDTIKEGYNSKQFMLNLLK